MQGVSMPPYVGCTHLNTIERAGKTYVLFIASAYNAGGLIGPEHNGIVVACVTDKRIMLDRHTEQDTGYFGPSTAQVAELGRITNLPADEFLAFVKSHPRYRGDIVKPARVRNPVKAFCDHALKGQPCYPDRAWKLEFHRLGKMAARRIAKDLGLTQTRVRSNPAGIACTGEVWLHSENFWLQFDLSAFGPPRLMFRGIENGRNRFMSYTLLRDEYERALEAFRIAVRADTTALLHRS